MGRKMLPQFKGQEVRGSSRSGGFERQTINVRTALPGDVEAIAALVAQQALRGNVLPRTIESIYNTINDWFVAEVEGVILGCVSLLPYTPSLIEVRSLVVDDQFQGLGIGRRLVKVLIAEVESRLKAEDVPAFKRLHPPLTLFALTRTVNFFERFGFVVSTREHFPQKVWRDCLQCPLLDNCDETAVVFHLGDDASYGDDAFLQHVQDRHTPT